ncbi:chloride channel protein [Companilactobacillus sp.]|uniref:chloride channel protein n=1 Tax=Companilactobacillus sp. TaxID=2767905 RepID=UPI00262022AB|nr:chloride channel protein [Companilactobacillus sp.]
MKKFDSVFVLYSIVLGTFVGVCTGLYMTLVNFLIEFIWTDIPQWMNTDRRLYPLVVTVIGGIIIGLLQKFYHGYPKTMEQVLAEFKTTGRIEYRHEVRKTFFTAIPALAFGGSIGPEASLTGIVGGLVNWVGDHLKLTLGNREELTKMGIGAIFSTVFHAPFAGIGNAFDATKGDFKHRSRKIIVYTLTVIFGVLGFVFINKLFPHESSFGIHLSKNVQWSWQAFALIPLALVIGLLFGKIFVWTGNYLGRFTKKVDRKVCLPIAGGVILGLVAMISPYFLFSGETSVLDFSKNAVGQSFWVLFGIAVGKTLIANLCFCFGWRGGLIFPAIFSSVAMGFAFIAIFPYTPGLLISIIVAVSITTIVEQPGVVAGLLLLLLPIQFFPFVIIAAYLTKYTLGLLRKYRLS